MIIDFGNKETKLIFEGIVSDKVPHQIQQIARRKLRMLNNSQNINDLRIPPSNHLEKLVGKYKGQNSMRINNTWRIVFDWVNNNAYNVTIIDYH